MTLRSIIQSLAGLTALVLATSLTPVFVRPAAAAGMTCTMSGPTLNLGTINPYGGYPYSTSGSMVVSCSNSNAVSTSVAVCVSIGVGSGGTTAANRTLASGSNKLGIRVTNGSTDIGDGTSYQMDGPFSGTASARGTIGGNLPITVSVPSPATAPPPGTYSTTFNGTSAVLYYVSYAAGGAAPASCSALVASSPSMVQFTIQVNGTVPTECTVSSTSLAFPTTSLLTAEVDATATVTTNCNTSVPVTIALDNGATGTGPTTRQMKSSSNVITYGIYQDSGRTVPWGNTSGSNTVSAPNGSATTTAYGKVPPQVSQAPGSYSDVVNVTINY